MINKTKIEELHGQRPTQLDKIVRIGSIKNKSTFVHIEYKNKKLSITGVIGAKSNGDAESCGQINNTIKESLSDIVFDKSMDNVKILQLLNYWNDWHLNDMRAGNPKQQAFIKQWKAKGNKYESYDQMCAILAQNDLLKVDGYKYGSAWLFEEVPTNVLVWLEKLSESTKQPVWI